MADIERLIQELSSDAAPVRPLPSPLALGLRMGAILLAYAVIVSLSLGLRTDLALQLQRPAFAAEIFLLLALVAASLRGAILLAFPDQYQSHALRAPLILSSLFVLLLTGQGFMQADPRMVIITGGHGMECALCIASVAIVPSALMLAVLRKGASVRPRMAGALSVLASAGIGCLTLRLAEANDSLAHLAFSHYLPTLFFAALGAFAGKIWLKW